MQNNVSQYAELNALLRVLSRPLATDALHHLSKGPLTVNELTDRIGQPQASVSKALTVLRFHNLVSYKKVGVKHVYRMEPTELMHVISALSECVSGDIEVTA
ncbi:regulatory protein, arsR family [Pseudarthrobacter equi]|uniref:Regulatory protein, arsR family n=1 Tax=Pseudarthrobacter equi TaxID=728066 RepID=A0A1H2A794_9MICC|nr:metalloregulator ArsR/SmtB family transcription factor [Pseudarthrobacter equi]SDT41769.1 regulatory protein, arsR family [Pseudarthrobacter equi]